MLLVSECVARAALARRRVRGGHTRDDYPAMNARGGKREPRLHGAGGRPTGRRRVPAAPQDVPPIRADLLALFERSELEKYLTATSCPPTTGGGAT